MSELIWPTSPPKDQIPAGPFSLTLKVVVVVSSVRVMLLLLLLLLLLPLLVVVAAAAYYYYYYYFLRCAFVDSPFCRGNACT